MLIRDLVDHISESLNDREGITWSRKFLLEVINEGQCLTAKYRPDMFVKTVTVKLKPGTTQTTCDCVSIKKIVAQVDKYGNVIKSIPQATSKVTSRWTGGSHCPPSAYKVGNYTFDKMNQKEFEVSPAVPVGTEVFVTLLCVTNPGDLTENSSTSDCGLESAIIQWALYRALMVDNQASSVSVAQAHYKAFFELLQLQFVQQQKVQATPDVEK